MFLDCFDAGRAALGFAYHADQAGVGQQVFGEFVHAGCRGRTGRTHHFIAYRIHRPNVVDEFAFEIDAFRQPLAALVEFDHAFVGGVATGEHLAAEQQRVTGFPGGDLFPRNSIEIDAARGGADIPGDLRIVAEVRCMLFSRTAAIKHEVGVARCCAVRNHRHRQRCRVGRVILDLHIQHRGETAKPLRADTECVDLLHQFKPQLFDTVVRTARAQFVDINRIHQRFFCQHCSFLGGTTDADAQHSRRAPACAHGRNCFHYPIHNAVAWVQHYQLRFVLGTTALGSHLEFHGVTRYQPRVYYCRCVVFGVLAGAGRVTQYRCAQHVVGMQVGAAYTFIDHVLQPHVAFPAHVHAYIDEHGDNASVLTNGPVAFGAHAGVDQYLRHRVPGGL